LANELVAIEQPYLIVLFSLPFYKDQSGRSYLNDLWAKDLVEHARYLPNLLLASPLSNMPPPENAVCIDEIPQLRSIQRIELSKPRGVLSVVSHIAMAAQLWKALERAAIVHTSVAGWPIPEAWFIVPMLRLRRRFLIIGVESAFWRLVPGEASTFWGRLRSRTTEWLNRQCIECADLSFFTHQDYMRTLLRKYTSRGFLNEATWIDDAQVISTDRLEALIHERSKRTSLSLACASRLTTAKGVIPLIRSSIELLQEGIDLTLDIYGDGPCSEQCKLLVAQAHAERFIRFHGNLPYGVEFLDAIGRHDMLVVPNLSDEQPRIVYDAFSQGVPVLAAATSGLKQCVDDGRTGMFFPPADWPAMKMAIATAAEDRGSLAALARNAAVRARNSTHRLMHVKRSMRIASAFSAWRR
jgi:glycosyltransferase involved in cell wall biosynthesis